MCTRWLEGLMGVKTQVDMVGDLEDEIEKLKLERKVIEDQMNEMRKSWGVLVNPETNVVFSSGVTREEELDRLKFNLTEEMKKLKYVDKKIALNRGVLKKILSNARSMELRKTVASLKSKLNEVKETIDEDVNIDDEVDGLVDEMDEMEVDDSFLWSRDIDVGQSTNPMEDEMLRQFLGDVYEPKFPEVPKGEITRSKPSPVNTSQRLDSRDMI